MLRGIFLLIFTLLFITSVNAISLSEGDILLTTESLSQISIDENITCDRIEITPTSITLEGCLCSTTNKELIYYEFGRINEVIFSSEFCRRGILDTFAGGFISEKIIPAIDEVVEYVKDKFKDYKTELGVMGGFLFLWFIFRKKENEKDERRI